MPEPVDAAEQAAHSVPADPALVGARIRDVRQPDDATLLLETYHSGIGGARWRFSLHAEGARLGREFSAVRQGGPPPAFCQWLRARVLGGRVEAVTLRHPQILVLTVRKRDGRFQLVLELNRRNSNLLLLDGDGRVLIAMRHPTLPGRKLAAGSPYAPPPRLHAFPRAIPLRERYPAADERAARALAERWREREAGFALEARRGPALQLARRELKKRQRRLAKLELERADVHEADKWRRQGELLQIHRGRLAPGMASVEVADVFQADAPLLTIPLDTRAGPGANIERYFKRFRKLRDASSHVEDRISVTARELGAWRQRLDALENAARPDDLEALAASLPAAERGLKALLLGAEGSRSRAPSRRPPMRRSSAEGYDILVGRSGKENEQVTFRLGRGRDWWFHAQGIAGSHVLVINPSGAALPARTVREAAWLAGYYSQGRQRGRVEVDYTQRKHVRKMKGGRPGEVTYSQNRSVLVDLSHARLKEVLHREPRRNG